MITFRTNASALSEALFSRKFPSIWAISGSGGRDLFKPISTLLRRVNRAIKWDFKGACSSDSSNAPHSSWGTVLLGQHPNLSLFYLTWLLLELVPSTMSLISSYSNDHPYAFSDQATVDSKKSAWYQEAITPSYDKPEPTGQSSQNHSSKSSFGFAPPTTHTFQLNAACNNNAPLISVDLHSWASSSTSLPTYMEGQCISGQVQINLSTPDKVKAVSISVSAFRPNILYKKTHISMIDRWILLDSWIWRQDIFASVGDAMGKLYGWPALELLVSFTRRRSFGKAAWQILLVIQDRPSKGSWNDCEAGEKARPRRSKWYKASSLVTRQPWPSTNRLRSCGANKAAWLTIRE